MIRFPKHNKAESIVRGFSWNKRNDRSTKKKHRKYSVEERKRLPFVSQTTQCLMGVSTLLVPSHLARRIHRCTINRIKRQIKVLREPPIGMNRWMKSTFQRNNREICVLTNTVSLNNSNLKRRERDLRIMVDLWDIRHRKNLFLSFPLEVIFFNNSFREICKGNYYYSLEKREKKRREKRFLTYFFNLSQQSVLVIRI